MKLWYRYMPISDGRLVDMDVVISILATAKDVITDKSVCMCVCMYACLDQTEQSRSLRPPRPQRPPPPDPSKLHRSTRVSKALSSLTSDLSPWAQIFCSALAAALECVIFVCSDRILFVCMYVCVFTCLCDLTSIIFLQNNAHSHMNEFVVCLHLLFYLTNFFCSV